MVHLHRSKDKEQPFYVTFTGDNEEVMYTSETQHNKKDVLNSVNSHVQQFDGAWDGYYKDHTGKKPRMARFAPVASIANPRNTAGIRLIIQERGEQMNKHGQSIEDDVLRNRRGQLRDAAYMLLRDYRKGEAAPKGPKGWRVAVWKKMWNKPYNERIVIAAALLAAESDRVMAIAKP